jgi:pimeloyl-ACP methyl ester carboxylesterase
MERKGNSEIAKRVFIPSRSLQLEGELVIPDKAIGIVLFAHGSGSSRHSPRNQFVAKTLTQAAIGTLLFDLLTKEEEEEDRFTGHLRFNIKLLAERLVNATKWLREPENLRRYPVGYFGSSTGAAAALVAAATVKAGIAAVVSRGGRPDLAGTLLPFVYAPTLLIIGSRDVPVIELNTDAYRLLRCEKRIEIVTGAGHLFEEPGTLEEVARLAADWFRQHFTHSQIAADVSLQGEECRSVPGSIKQ